MSNKRFYGPFFKFFHRLVAVFKKPYSIDGWEMQDGPVVYVSHHQNLFGPFTTLLSSPIHLHCWILNVFLDKKACFEHYRNYTFTKRLGWSPWLASIAASIVSTFVPTLLNSGQGIPVYRGKREILQTFNISVEALKRNESIVIFPDKDYSDTSSTTGELYEGFLFIERYYYKETGKHITFVPLYVSQSQRSIYTGQPVQFRDEEKFTRERKIVIEKIRDELNVLASKYK